MDYSEFKKLSEVDADYLQANYLTGFQLFNGQKQPFPVEFFEEKLRNALNLLEKETGIDVLERDTVGERHDYHALDYLNYAFMQLFRVPCTSVSEVRAVFPDGAMVQIFPTEWVRLEIEQGMLNLVPIGGTVAQIVVGRGGFYPLIWFSDYLPHLWEVDYRSGFNPNEIPRIIVDAICKIASIEILSIVSDLINPLGVGSQSLSVDGLSQSRGYLVPAFQARINQYRADVFGTPGVPGTGIISQIRSTYFGVRVTAA